MAVTSLEFPPASHRSTFNHFPLNLHASPLPWVPCSIRAHGAGPVWHGPERCRYSLTVETGGRPKGRRPTGLSIEQHKESMHMVA